MLKQTPTYAERQTVCVRACVCDSYTLNLETNYTYVYISVCLQDTKRKSHSLSLKRLQETVAFRDFSALPVE